MVFKNSMIKSLFKRSKNPPNSRISIEMSVIREAFDTEFYLSQYPDIAQNTAVDPLKHYCDYGWREGRDPSTEFSTFFYLETNPDVQSAGINPLFHYVSAGKNEGRLPIKFNYSSTLFSPIDEHSLHIEDADEYWKMMKSHQPYKMKLEQQTFPLVLFSNTGQPVPSERVREALLFTEGNVYVGVNRISKTDVTNTVDSSRVIYFDVEKVPTSRDLINILSELKHNKVGIWESNFIPTVGSWSFLELTLSLKSKCAYAGPSICRRDGFIWRSGTGINQTNDQLEHRDVGRTFFNPLSFRKRPTITADPCFGLYRTSALRKALMGIEGDSSMLDGLTLGMALHPDFELYTQGCAVVFAKGVPPESKSYPPLTDEMRERVEPKNEQIVFVDSLPPWPDQDAGSVTAWNFLDIFQERGADVLFYSTTRRTWDNQYVLALAARGIICLTDRSIADYDKACDLIEEEHDDDRDKLTFVLSRIHAGGMHIGKTRARFSKAKVIFNTVDLHGLRELREAKIAGSASREFSAHTTYSQERAIIQMSDITILLSEAEMAELMPTHGYANLKLIPMINEFNQSKAAYKTRNGLAFIGGYAHQPNIDAIEYIINDLWEPIRAKIPDITLDLVGPNFPDELKLRLPEGVRAVGYVEDLEAKLEEVRLTIAPLRYGAGIKGKIGTSLAHGVPCVATSVAAEGMGLKKGKEIIIADTPKAFAEELAKLYKQPKNWAQISKAGFDFCKAHYSRDAVAVQLNALLDEEKK